MIGLRNRGALPTVVQDEFENLFARIKEFFLREHNEDGTHLTTSASLSVVPIGAEMAWPTDAAPSGWILARGQQVSRITYKSYFDLVSTLYGVGDGILTFNVPNIQGRTVYGKATAGTGATLGGTFGAIDHTHTGPSHTHSGPSHTHTGPSHTHGLSALETAATDTSGSAQLDYTAGAATAFYAVGGHAHFTTTNTETSDAGGTGATSADGTGATGAGGTGATSASNPPGIAQNWIIYVGVAA